MSEFTRSNAPAEFDASDYPEVFEKAARSHQILRDRSIYPMSIDVAVRMRDIDINRHVNNSALADMYEEARAKLWLDHLLKDPTTDERVSYVVASFQIDFLAEAFWGTPLTFHMGVSYLGERSWRERAVAYQGDKCVAVTATTAVLKPTENTRVFSQRVHENLVSNKLLFKNF